jgi:hypothetical protein
VRESSPDELDDARVVDVAADGLAEPCVKTAMSPIATSKGTQPLWPRSVDSSPAGSGFIAGHCILQLHEQGYVVRTTVRSPKHQSAVRAVLTDAGMANGDALTFVEADLTRDAG